MTIQDWRKDKSRVKQAAQIISTPFFKEMLETVIESQRLSHKTSKTGFTSNDHSYMLGLIDGHQYAISALKDLGELLTPQTDVPLTYGSELK